MLLDRSEWYLISITFSGSRIQRVQHISLSWLGSGFYLLKKTHSFWSASLAWLITNHSPLTDLFWHIDKVTTTSYAMRRMYSSTHNQIFYFSLGPWLSFFLLWYHLPLLLASLSKSINRLIFWTKKNLKK